MAYTTLMAHLEIGRSNAGMLQVVRDLAVRFNAAVIGIAAAHSRQPVDGEAPIPADRLHQSREVLDREIDDVEAEFRTALQTHVSNLEWRSNVTETPLADYLAQEARSTDLIITNGNRHSFPRETSRHASTDELVMQAGRPVLVVPAGAARFRFEHALVAWKDTREARRVVVEALPFLQHSESVTVVEIAPEEDLVEAEGRLVDVVRLLRRHGIVAEAITSASKRYNARRLRQIAQERRIDLIVAGAHGHSRLQQRVLGGVTRDLLLNADRCSLVSH